MSCLSLRRSGVARVNEELDSITCRAPTHLSISVMSHTCLYSPAAEHQRYDAIRYTLCPKNVTALPRYNSDIHEFILIILVQMLLRSRQSKGRPYFIFRPHLTSAAALPGKTNKDKNNTFSLKCCRPTVALPDFNQSLA